VARYDILLFIDSDCEASAQLIEEHLRVYQNDDCNNLGGVLGVTEFTGKSNWVWKIIEKSPFIDAFTFAKRMPNAVWCTCSNVSFKKQIFEELGGFDEDFPFKLGGDDLDFSWRVTQAGYLLKCNDRALAFHTKKTWQRLPAICERIFRWGRMSYYVMKKHKSRLQFKLPGLILIGFVALAIGSVVALVKSNRSLFFSLYFDACLMVGGSFLFWRERRCNLTDIFQHIGAYLLSLLYQAGAAIEIIRHAHFGFFVKAIYFDDWHHRAEYQRQMRRIWVVIVSLALAFLTWG
jgi:GT2 family glycosyltransferase